VEEVENDVELEVELEVDIDEGAAAWTAKKVFGSFS
jgi:hypothetical protein